jgi:hypothetical protein
MLAFIKRIEAKVDESLHLLRLVVSMLTNERQFIMSALDDLEKQVQANTDAEASAVALIKGLAEQVAQAASDPAKVTALAAKLKASADALGAAVFANTPAAPAPATPA